MACSAPPVGSVVRPHVRRAGVPRGVSLISITVALDVEAITEQAEDEGPDAPAGADRAWWGGV